MRGIESCKASQFFGVHLIAFAIAVRDRTELADVRHDDFMPKFSKLLTDPDRVSARFHRDTHRLEIAKTSVQARRRGPKSPSIHNLAHFTQRAVVAPDIPKIDPIVDPTLKLRSGTSAMRW